MQEVDDYSRASAVISETRGKKEKWTKFQAQRNMIFLYWIGGHKKF